jgi:hypothetical protein
LSRCHIQPHRRARVTEQPVDDLRIVTADADRAIRVILTRPIEHMISAGRSVKGAAR